MRIYGDKMIFYKTLFLVYKMGVFWVHLSMCQRRDMAIFFATYPQQARIAADCILYAVMNAYSISI